MRAFGGPISTHRADDDVAATCLVYRVLLAAVDNMPTPLLQHIAGMCDTDTWNTERVFKCLAAMKLARDRTTCVLLVSRGRSSFCPLRPDANVPDVSPAGEKLLSSGGETSELSFATDTEISEAFSAEAFWALCTKNMSRVMSNGKWHLR